MIAPETLLDWLVARSIARGLPAPVSDRGGFRVDTGSGDEVRRWLFIAVCDGLIDLLRSIALPGHPVKLLGSAEEMQAILPDGWKLHAPSYFMASAGAPGNRTPPPGYRLVVETEGPVNTLRIIDQTGDLAASGYAAETDRVFVYDRISVAAGHRRKGLGSAIMTALRQRKRQADLPELLVATEEGRELYETLGWRVLSHYTTASIGAD